MRAPIPPQALELSTRRNGLHAYPSLRVSTSLDCACTCALPRRVFQDRCPAVLRKASRTYQAVVACRPLLPVPQPRNLVQLWLPRGARCSVTADGRVHVAGRVGWWIVAPFQMAICFGSVVANHIVAGQAMKVWLHACMQALFISISLRRRPTRQPAANLS